MASPKKTGSVWDLPRNDVEACHKFWQAKQITGEDWRVMLRLQDDPKELIGASKKWKKQD